MRGGDVEDEVFIEETSDFVCSVPFVVSPNAGIGGGGGGAATFVLAVDFSSIENTVDEELV